MTGFRMARTAFGALLVLTTLSYGSAMASSEGPGTTYQQQPQYSDMTTPTVIDEAMKESDGTKGYTMKALGQSMYLAGKNRSFVFEPASTIKILHLVHAVRAVQQGPVTYQEQIEVSDKCIGGGDDCSQKCPLEPEDWWQDSYTFSEPLWDSLSYMMWASDNPRTDAVKRRFTQAAINQTAASVIGTSNTLLQHRIGCNSDAVGAHNQLTLNDASRIYEKAFQPGLLDDQRRAELRQLMPNSHSTLLSAVAKEFGWLTPQYDPEKAEAFWAQTKISFKAGSYSLSESGIKYYRSIAGWVELPYECHSGDLEWTCPKQFTFGLFINKATNAGTADSAYGDGLYELFRTAVRKAIQSYH